MSDVSLPAINLLEVRIFSNSSRPSTATHMVDYNMQLITECLIHVHIFHQTQSLSFLSSFYFAGDIFSQLSSLFIHGIYNYKVAVTILVSQVSIGNWQWLMPTLY